MPPHSGSQIRVVAEQTGTFYGQAMTAGDIYTVAGNGQGGYFGDGHPGSQARLADPAAVAADGMGIYIADCDNYVIREAGS